MPYDKAKDLGPENPPPDNGPALEWFADAKSTMWGSAVFALILLLAFLTLRWGGLGRRVLSQQVEQFVADAAGVAPGD